MAKTALVCMTLVLTWLPSSHAACDLKEGDACSATDYMCPMGTFCYASSSYTSGTDKCTKMYQGGSGATCDQKFQCKLGLYCDTAAKKCADRKADGATCTGSSNDGCFGKYFCDTNDPSGSKCRAQLSVAEGGTAYSDRACEPGLEVVSNKCTKITTMSNCQGTLVRGWCSSDNTCKTYSCTKEYLTNEEMTENQVNQDYRKMYESSYALVKCQAKSTSGTAPSNSMSPVLIAMIAVAGAMFLCALTMMSLFLLARRRAALATSAANANNANNKSLDDEDEELEEEPDLVDDGSETKA